MEKKFVDMLKNDLKEAIDKKDYARIIEIKNLLNISDEQAKYFDMGLTGFPSIDKVWLSHYAPGAEDKANNAPRNMTVWQWLKEKIIEYYDYPALEYFGRIISRPEFEELVYTWARTFRAMGIEPDELVPVYGPVTPDIAAMFLGLNIIGATPYFLKLAINEKALAEETADAKFAIVYDGMWPNVAKEFSKDKFKKVMVATVTADMPSPKKEIVSFLSAIQAKKNHSGIPDDKKFIWADKAKDIANYYTGEVEVPFKPNRVAAITSSSGTTVGGVVKGTMATNESIIAQVMSGTMSEIPYEPGYRVLNHFPFTASTSMNSLFLLALYNGLTVINDPRVSPKDFYNQLMKLKPNIALTTGSSWELYFNRLEEDIKRGKKPDLSFAKGWTIGGEGTDTDKYIKWNNIMKECGAEGIYSGYGLSEVFSAVSVEKVDTRYDCSKQIMSVGLPQAGMITGIFDKDGKEKSYDERGELWIKSNAQMLGYYKKPELTAETVVDGWVKTGDIASIDINGFLYVWGRMKDKIQTEDGASVQLFDVANKIKEKEYINDAIVLSMPIDYNEYNLVAHIVWNESVIDEDKTKYINDLDEMLKEYLPAPIKLNTYADHEGMLPYSPTTLKKDKNKLSNQTNGYYQAVVDPKLGEVLQNVEYYRNEETNDYKKVFTGIKEQNLGKSRKRRIG